MLFNVCIDLILWNIKIIKKKKQGLCLFFTFKPQKKIVHSNYKLAILKSLWKTELILFAALPITDQMPSAVIPRISNEEIMDISTIP